MKKILKYSILAVLALAASALTACRQELDTDQLSGPVALAALSPNPVVRGAELHIFGTSMDKVVEVRIPGVAPITAIKSGTGNDYLQEIVVTVPLEGPEIGKVTVADAQGNTSSSKFDLTYTEGMVFEDLSCAEEVYPGDVITITGEYVYNTKEVIFTSGSGESYVNGDRIFDKTRHSVKVYVPSNATSGPIKISDVDELNDASSIPTIYPSPKGITVGKPTVDKTEFVESIKAGTLLTFTGAHLDMVEKVEFSGVEQESFEVNDDATELSAALPAKAADGDVVFTTFAGDTFVAGTLEGLLPSGLKISVDLESDDPRYKAGYKALITGEDLDLVTEVSFGGAKASFAYDPEAVPPTVYAIIPEEGKDGDVVVTLDNGATVVVDAIEIVNPTVEKVSATEIVARESFEFTGKDLELITKVSVGGVESKFHLDTLGYREGLDEDGFVVKIPVLDSTKVIVVTAPDILTGDVVIEKLNGWSQAISQMTVSYKELITLEVPESVALGKKFVATGTNLFAIEQVYIKGKKIVGWATHTDTEISFDLPEGMGPGVYRLDLVLSDGSTLTWAIPFAVTAPYTETYIFDGYEDLGSWSSQPYLGADGAFAESGMVVGDQVRIYYTPLADWWQFQVFGGHWESMTFPELGGGNTVSPENQTSGAAFFTFEVTDDNYAILTGAQGWGGALLTQGENVAITGVSLIHFGVTETVVWEGESDHTGDYANNILLGGEDDWVNAGLSEGAEVRIYFTPDDPEDWSIQIFDGHWTGMGYVTPDGTQWNAENSPEAAAKGYVSFVAEGDAFTALTTKAYWGYALILQGKDVVFTKLVYM